MSSIEGFGGLNIEALVAAMVANMEADGAEEEEEAGDEEFVAGAVDTYRGATATQNVEAIYKGWSVDISTMSVDDIIFFLMMATSDAFNRHIQKAADDVTKANAQVNGASGERETQDAQRALDQATQFLQRLLTKRDQLMTMYREMLKSYDKSVEQVWK